MCWKPKIVPKDGNQPRSPEKSLLLIDSGVHANLNPDTAGIAERAAGVNALVRNVQMLHDLVVINRVVPGDVGFFTKSIGSEVTRRAVEQSTVSVGVGCRRPVRCVVDSYIRRHHWSVGAAHVVRRNELDVEVQERTHLRARHHNHAPCCATDHLCPIILSACQGL